MNATAIPVGALGKLIAIRREALDLLRQDVMRLRVLCEQAEADLGEARQAASEFLEETRRSERGTSPLFVDRMQERRHYLAHLETHCGDAERTLAEVSEQQQKAQVAFETCHKEVRALERLSERRETVARQMRQRRDYRHADDEELLRCRRIWEAHDIDR